MFGPGDLIRLPAGLVGGVLRIVDEVVRIRRDFEELTDWLHPDVEQLKKEFAHVRERADKLDAWLHEDVNTLKDEFAHVREKVDELTNTLPTATKGPIDKVKDALTTHSDD